eukprot:RCo042677
MRQYIAGAVLPCSRCDGCGCGSPFIPEKETTVGDLVRPPPPTPHPTPQTKHTSKQLQALPWFWPCVVSPKHLRVGTKAPILSQHSFALFPLGERGGGGGKVGFLAFSTAYFPHFLALGFGFVSSLPPRRTHAPGGVACVLSVFLPTPWSHELTHALPGSVLSLFGRVGALMLTLYALAPDWSVQLRFGR